MKQKYEIILSCAVLVVIGGFLAQLWLGKTESRNTTVVQEDGTLVAKSNFLVTARSAYEEDIVAPTQGGVFSSLGKQDDEATEKDVDQGEEKSVAVAHGTEQDVESGFGIGTFIQKWKKQAKEKEEEEERKKEEEEEEEEREERVLVARTIGTGRTEPFYPREENDTVNREARSLLIQTVENVERGGSFGEVLFGSVEIDVPPQQISIRADDAHQRRMLDELKSLQIWAGNHKIIFSEMGVDNSDDDGKYIALLGKFFEAANAMGYSLTTWAAGDWWGDYVVSISGGGEILNSGVARPFVENGSTDLYIRGVNLAGGEFGMNPDAQGAIGNFNDQYTYHADSRLWKSIRERGMTHARIPFRLERLFNNDGSFDEGDKRLFLQAVAKARSEGVKILLDPHNYAALQMDGKREVLGEGRFSQNLYNTMMGNLAQMAVENADVIDMIGLMNEPKNLNPADWERYAQSAVNTIRARGFRGVIEVPTGNWQGVQDVPRIHPNGPWITDPGNNFMYGVHHYFDENHSGHYQRTYAEDEAALRPYYSPGSVSVWQYGNAQGASATYEDYPCPPESDIDGNGWGWDGQKGCRVN